MDDQILFTLTAEGMHEMLNFIIASVEPFGLRLSPAKCELICFHQPGSIDKSMVPVVRIGDKRLSWKSLVVYLGSQVAEDGNILAAIKHRICCADTVAERLTLVFLSGVLLTVD